MRRSIPEEVELFPVCTDPIVIAFPSGHPCAAGQEFRLGDLAKEAWINTNAGSEFSELHAHVCSTIGNFRADVRHRTDSFHVSLALVANGCGLAMVPELTMAFAPKSVVLRTPIDFTIDRIVSLAIRTHPVKTADVRIRRP
ncbi:hypothetical protein EN817_23205 [Mesorhizobium sp. M3A.F.Ca.ET.174.01.1.1]|nr:hypothetical protein EN818_21290 [Mesorhizobium sp. M3A.F.Ca.ET.175.01.1.1]TGT23021.1 hypothetical protein EN817_23205 [Mesorhizobium sp. M3A.F.Ca.ET.174.01.1.1]TIU07449.1 MAG: hypothetical protein E5W44_21265 [Mesorhizobium sp.]